MTRRPTGRALWIVAAVAIAALTLSPSGERVSGTISMCVICGDMGGVNAILNVLLFVPLGAGLALDGVRPARAIPAMGFATILIEVLQLGFVPGRDASVGDVVANAVGGAIGFLIGTNFESMVRPSARGARVLMGLWLCAWVLLQAAAAYALHPQPTNAAYFGQLAHALGGKPAYSGHVLSAAIGGAGIPDGRFPDSRPIADSLRAASGAEVSAVVSPRYAPQLLSVVRIADQEEREILNLAADETDLVVGVRTGASALRLRPVLVALHGVFDDGARAAQRGVKDTVRVRARYGFQRVEIAATRRGREPLAETVRLSTAKSWRLLSPVVVYADASALQSALDALWLLVGLAPAGYWAVAANRRAPRFRPRMTVAAIALVLVVGLAVIPTAAHLALPTPVELLGALAGLIAGGATSACAGLAQLPDTKIVA